MKEQKTKTIQKEMESPSSTSNRTRQRNPNNPLTAEEVDKLLANVTVLEDKVLLTLGFSSGMRVGEIVGIDPARMSEGEQSLKVWDEKKDKEKVVYLPMAVLSLMKGYYDQRADKSSPKFFNYSKKTVERKIQHWTEKVLAKRKSWHCVRHTYITLSSERKVPIEIVIQNTGDKPSTILQYYSQPSPAFIRKEIEEKKLFKVL